MAFELLKRTGPMADLTPGDFEDCLAFLAGELAAPAGAYEPEPGAAPLTSPRIWKHNGLFGVRDRRVIRWFWSNVGTIHSEEAMQVLENRVAIGTLESNYAERLAPGDRFILDGRALEVKRVDASIMQRPTRGEPSLPRWTSDRQSLSIELARELSDFRVELGRRVVEDGPNNSAVPG